MVEILEDKQRTTKMIAALKILHMRRGWEIWNCFPWRTESQGDLRNVYKYLMKVCKEDGGILLSVVPSERARGMGYTLRDYENKNFTVRVVKRCNRLWGVAAKSPSLEMLVGSLLQLPLLSFQLDNLQKSLLTSSVLGFSALSESRF